MRVIDNLEVMMKEEVKELDSGFSNSMSMPIFTIICLLMMPVMLIRNFNRIKILGVIITILNASLIVQVIGYFIYD
jgi:hypothetical protein